RFVFAKTEPARGSDERVTVEGAEHATVFGRRAKPRGDRIDRDAGGFVNRFSKCIGIGFQLLESASPICGSVCGFQRPNDELVPRGHLLDRATAGLFQSIDGQRQSISSHRQAEDPRESARATSHCQAWKANRKRRGWLRTGARSGAEPSPVIRALLASTRVGCLRTGPERGGLLSIQ